MACLELFFFLLRNWTMPNVKLQQCPRCNKWVVNLTNIHRCTGALAAGNEEDKEQCKRCKRWFKDINNHKKCKDSNPLVPRRDSATPSVDEDGKHKCPDCNRWYVDLSKHVKCTGRDTSPGIKLKPEQLLVKLPPDGKDQCINCKNWYVDLAKHRKCSRRDENKQTERMPIQRSASPQWCTLAYSDMCRRLRECPVSRDEMNTCAEKMREIREAVCEWLDQNDKIFAPWQSITCGSYAEKLKVSHAFYT